MIKVLPLAFLFSFFCIQTEYHVEKIWLFSKTQYTGAVPVNRNGKQLQTRSAKIICYLKISSKNELPDWQTAFVYGNRYSIDAVLINQDSVSVGTLKNSNSVVTIKAGTGFTLLQLIFTPQGKIEKPEAWQFILNGTLHDKEIYIRSNERMVELTPDLMP
jgi:hypothetical protein